MSRHFEFEGHRRFDLFHAQDAISGNALATMKQRGMIRRFARTVHHIDNFSDPLLTDWQMRSITQADELFVVSLVWQKYLASELGRPSTLIGNGVDTTRFSRVSRTIDQQVRARHGITGKHVLLAVGTASRNLQKYRPHPRGIPPGSDCSARCPTGYRRRRIAARSRRVPPSV